ncbi:hypothetical protein AMAG_01415 [Allomyces macrogynus ATCC 38327]|uniref:CRAL-TRIO domain-containing protein n=1 Tax=Allomyces macrogynus (strain ATCC 38327) TaxID=578462 RepID=A0A0L0RYW5_ALLM3|nr:hypothetical protein AMAG_01415 [Allomyces macrogynus ATCC 38327]|eukprot:KNE55528.1 hypothetical protein AMAG_01415 [Allomyces macrogynus ATCC 38327]
MASTTTGYLGNLADDQKTALAALAKGLTKEAFAAEGLTEPSDVFIWGVDLSGVTDTANDMAPGPTRVLLKFLRAREWDVEKSRAMLINCLKWRKEFGMPTFLTTTFPDSMTGAGAVYGRDREGNPVTWNFYGAMNAAQVFETQTAADFVRWRVQLMERAVAQVDLNAASPTAPETVMQVHDYAGASMRPTGTMREATKAIIAIFQDNYPEWLACKLFINVPGVMETLFQVLTVFTPARTKAKFRMVGASAARGALVEKVALENLPPQYGGLPAAFTPLPTSPSDASGDKIARPAAPVEPVAETVPARGTRTVWVPVTKDQVLHYHMVTTGLDVAFAAGFAPAKGDDASVPKDVADKKSLERKEMAAGEIVAPENGFVYLCFDNAFSYFTSKQVLYVTK